MSRSVTVVVGVIMGQLGHLLHVMPSKRRVYEFPGGKVERNEGDVTGLMREIWEETGITFTPDAPRLLGTIHDMVVDDGDFFRTGASAGTRVEFRLYWIREWTPAPDNWSPPEEIQCLVWSPMHELPWSRGVGGAHHAFAEIIRFHGNSGLFGPEIAEKWRRQHSAYER